MSVIINPVGSGGGASVGGGSYPAFILEDSSAVRWAVTVNTSGNLVTTVTPSGPSGALSLHSVILEDPTGLLWQVTILTSGNLVTTLYEGFIPSIDKIILRDSDSISWILTVSSEGNLVTT